MNRCLTHMLALVMLCQMVPTMAFGQAVSENKNNQTPVTQIPVSKAEQIYNLAFQRTNSLDADAVLAADDYLNSADAIQLIDFVIVAVGNDEGDILIKRNPGKGKIVALVDETQLMPELFKNYLVFKALYGCAIADTMRAEEINQFKVAKGVANDPAMMAKLMEVKRKFNIAAHAFGQLLFAQMTVLQRPALEAFGLDLNLGNNAPKN